MTYLFLDLDGVTHPTSANGRYFRQENLAPLAAAIKDLDIRVVITSTWRLDKPLDELKQLLGDIGELVVGVTPEVNEPFTKYIRQREVELYLEQHGSNYEKWIAVDDTAAFYQPDENLILTHGITGFTASDGISLRKLIKTI